MDTELANAFRDLRTYLDGLKASIDANFAEFREHIAEFREHVDLKFAEVNRRSDSHDRRFDLIAETLLRHEGRLDRIERRLENVGSL